MKKPRLKLDENANISTSELIDKIVEAHPEKNTSVSELVDTLSIRGFAFIMLFLGLITTVTIPGLTLLVGILPLFFSIQMMIGMHEPWLPKWMSERDISRSMLTKSADKAQKIISYLENKTKVRWMFFQSKAGERVIGAVCLICSLSIMIPLPATNLVPAIGIAIMSLGQLMRDGVVTIVGMLVGLGGAIFGFAVGYAIFWAGSESLKSLFG